MLKVEQSVVPNDTEAKIAAHLAKKTANCPSDRRFLEIFLSKKTATIEEVTHLKGDCKYCEPITNGFIFYPSRAENWLRDKYNEFQNKTEPQVKSAARL